MSKKIFIQILLIIIVSILIIVTFNFYNSDKVKKKTINSINNKEQSAKESESFNIIENLSYSSKDSFGNEYKINAKKSIINLDDKDIILMTDVNAVINMNNSEPIFIKSDFANYNTKNYDTLFKENIFLNHINHEIKGEKLNLLFKTNLVTMSGNLVYTNIDTVLNADKFEMNLITKNSKIYMNSKSKKINVLVAE